MIAYLQHGSADSWPMRTERVSVAFSPLPHHTANRSYTASGYGAKLPTPYKVRWGGRWRRVYSTCYSNVSTEWVNIDGARVVVLWSRSKE